MKVRLHQSSFFGETVSVEDWPVMTEEDVKDALFDLLADFDDAEIDFGITVAINCIIKDGDDLTPQYEVGIHTDGLGGREEVERCIEAGEIDWLGLHDPTINTTVELLEGGEQ